MPWNLWSFLRWILDARSGALLKLIVLMVVAGGLLAALSHGVPVLPVPWISRLLRAS